MTSRIKICGLKTPEAIAAAAEAGADYAGFVHFAKSPRHLQLDAIAAFVRDLPDRLKSVVLLVDPDDSLFADVMQIVSPDVIQLHGSETAERIRELKGRASTAIWKALPLKTEQAMVRAERFSAAADLVLFDAPAPPESKRPGGNGETADWSLLSRFPPEGDWGLAGGLTPDNVRDAIHQTSAPLVDVSSGVESEPGVKDVDKIKRFCQAVRRS